MKLFFPMKALFSALLLASGMGMMAQVTVRGVVRDVNDEPIIGATIVERGTSNGTATDYDGQFVLNVTNAQSILVFSYVGKQTLEAPAGKGDVSIVLRDNTELLDEVVVIGYGTAKRKDITTAVSSVNVSDLNQKPLTNAVEAIQGKAAGVTVLKPNGQPGVDMVIRVRGTTSMNASNDPLYVVDGVPMTDIGFLAPNDIESIQIMKDASSAAIYGSRAANGVVPVSYTHLTLPTMAVV